MAAPVLARQIRFLDSVPDQNPDADGIAAETSILLVASIIIAEEEGRPRQKRDKYTGLSGAIRQGARQRPLPLAWIYPSRDFGRQQKTGRGEPRPAN